MLRLTPAAADHFRRLLTKRAHPPQGIRLSVRVSGCSGFAYHIEYADIIEEYDHIVHSEGITLVIDPRSLPYLKDSELDYVKEGINYGLKFHNPNAKNTCGCGESFNI